MRWIALVATLSPVATRGVREGDAVAVLGYPGRSYRSWIADEMQEREALHFPALRDLYAEWIGVIGAESARSPQAAMATVDDLRTLEDVEHADSLLQELGVSPR